MANYKTGAQRHNDKQDKIFSYANDRAKKEGKSSPWEGKDMRSEAMKKEVASKMKGHIGHSKEHSKNCKTRKEYGNCPPWPHA